MGCSVLRWPSACRHDMSRCYIVGRSSSHGRISDTYVVQFNHQGLQMGFDPEAEGPNVGGFRIIQRFALRSEDT